MRCILHIGTAKTGTTALQTWMYANKAELSAERIYLSGMLDRPNNRLFPAFFQSRLDDWARANHIESIDEKEAFFEGFEQKLTAEIKDASKEHDVFIISSEHLHSNITAREEIAKIKEFLLQVFTEVTVLCYFRNQADMAVSLYSTALRHSSTASLDSFLNSELTPGNYYYNFKAIADNWSSAFGRKNCVFRLYDSEAFHGGDIRRDFLHAVGASLDMSKLDYSETDPNESLSALKGAIFREINRRIPFWDEKAGGRNSLNIQLKSQLDGLTCLDGKKFAAENLPEIEERFFKANTAFLKEYFPGHSGLKATVRQAAEGKSFALAEVEDIVSAVVAAVVQVTAEDSMHELLTENVDSLRDIALKIEHGEKPTMEDALTLMTLAQKARPDALFLQEKVRAYIAELDVRMETSA